MKEKDIRIEEYSYNLPDEKIAKYPLNKRDASKLLVYKNKKISEDIFKNITKYLKSDNLLVFNNTKVIRARLGFAKPTGAKIEIFCLEPYEPSDYAIAFQQKFQCSWRCLVGNLKKWKSEELTATIIKNDEHITLKALKRERENNSVIIEFRWEANVSFGEILELAGNIPIPPYLKRDSEKIDLKRYQTIYSRCEGSVAAPTAGLHFTEEVMESLKNNSIEYQELTLHVGAGTFKPVSTVNIGEHEMHTEHFSVTKSFINSLLKHNNITAVGTTSLRTIESLYWLGVKLIRMKNINESDLFISQWEHYKIDNEISKNRALYAIIKYLEENNLQYLNASTQIIIVPGYKFKIVNSLITNYHQPKSTLLLLIAAFVGNHWKSIYDYSIKNNFRFLSYGDSSLLFRT